MKRFLTIGVMSILILPFFLGFLFLGGAQAASKGGNHGKIVVANRGSGTLSIIDAHKGELIEHVSLPQDADENFPEPMYVVYVRQGNHVFVGDRANDRVVVFDADDFSVVDTILAGEGVFHMWADGRGSQLWVNNDIEKTTTVIDPQSLTVIATIPTPHDLVALGGKPHDVILDPGGKLAFVSVLGVSGENDYVIQFRTDTFEETGRVAVGKDPHLSLSARNRSLYVPTQGSDSVYVLNPYNLDIVEILDIPGAHGAGMTFNGKYFYTTNLPGAGAAALFTIDTQTNMIVGDPVNSPYPVPHNIALTKAPDKLYVSHSGGTSNKVSFYDVSFSDPVPVFSGEVTVGLNPFGLSFVP